MTNSSPHRTEPAPELNRRAVLTRAVAVGGVVALGGAFAACASEGTSGGTNQGDSDQGSPATTSVSDVPVGGGTIIADAQVVVTQPSEGQFKAFNAVCTHQGCLVAKVEQGAILCSCHNSAFSATDGSVVSGPATRALASRTVTVSGDTLTIA